MTSFFAISLRFMHNLSGMVLAPIEVLVIHGLEVIRVTLDFLGQITVFWRDSLHLYLSVIFSYLLLLFLSFLSLDFPLLDWLEPSF